MNKLILLNGPPRAGKDAIASILILEHGFKRVTLAGPLKQAVAHILGLPGFSLENIKDEPVEGSSVTPRDLMIQISEQVVKPIFGKDYWALLALKMFSYDGDIVITDLGFLEEFGTLVRNQRDKRQIELWTVTREGCTYENDSRQNIVATIMGAEENGHGENYVELLSCIEARTVPNNGTIRELGDTIRKLC